MTKLKNCKNYKNRKYDKTQNVTKFKNSIITNLKTQNVTKHKTQNVTKIKKILLFLFLYIHYKTKKNGTKLKENSNCDKSFDKTH